MASPTLPADIRPGPFLPPRVGVRAGIYTGTLGRAGPLPRLHIAEWVAGLSDPLEHKQGPGLGQGWAQAKVMRPQLPSEFTAGGAVQEGFLELLACSPGLGSIPVGRGRSGSSPEARQAAMRPPAQSAPPQGSQPRSSRCFLPRCWGGARGRKSCCACVRRPCRRRRAGSQPGGSGKGEHALSHPAPVSKPPPVHSLR